MDCVRIGYYLVIILYPLFTIHYPLHYEVSAYW